MKHIYYTLVFCIMLVSSCAPSRHAVQVEMRYPSRSGIELAGKIVSVVYLTDGNKEGDEFNANLAVGCRSL